MKDATLVALSAALCVFAATSVDGQPSPRTEAGGRGLIEGVRSLNDEITSLKKEIANSEQMIKALTTEMNNTTTELRTQLNALKWINDDKFGPRNELHSLRTYVALISRLYRGSGLNWEHPLIHDPKVD